METMKHGSLREGATVGVIVATFTWLWIAGVDMVTARPFHTFTALGGILVFTLAHYVLNILYGVVLVTGLRGSSRAPSLVIAVIFGLVMLEVAFAMLSAIMAIALGQVAWIVIFGGSLIGLGVALTLLNRNYPFVEYVRRAEGER